VHAKPVPAAAVPAAAVPGEPARLS
jgi:hypothetical protein